MTTLAIVTYKRIGMTDAIAIARDGNRVGNIYFADKNNQLIKVDGYRFCIGELPNIKFFEKRLEG